MGETITISKAEYDQLLKDSEFLEALRQSGVDNWDGYGESCDLVEKWNEEG